MNRRTFIATSAAAVFISTLTGCTSTDIAALVQTLGNSASQLAALEGNTSLASKLLTDTGAAVTAIDNWKSGSVATEVIEALNLVEDDLDLFPITNQFAPLIDLAIATAESIISLLPASATVGVTAHRHVQLGYAPPKNAHAYAKRYNAILAQHPEWPVSKLSN
jgi:hypothetical protein